MQKSLKGVQGGTIELPLNPFNFPQDNATTMATWNEDLVNNNKPGCQFDYSYKIGLAFNSLTAQSVTDSSLGNATAPEERLDSAANLTLNADMLGLPFALTSNPYLTTSAFIQYYGFLLHHVDQHIHTVLTELEASGQAENTIVIFCPDHGEYSGSHHMMMEKWHTGYEEMIHVPLVVRFPENYYRVEGGLQQFEQATSHADILPSILGLTGINTTEQQQELLAKISGHITDNTAMPVGSDFSQAIQRLGDINKPNSDQPREGVLFVTYDTITEPFKKVVYDGDNPPPITDKDGNLNPYSVFVEAIAKLKAQQPNLAETLGSGSVRQPNLVHCAVSNDNWKLVRYWDPAWLIDDAVFEPQQFELYNLNIDPAEEVNLLDVNDPNFNVIETVPEEFGSRTTVVDQANAMLTLLESLEFEWLNGWTAPTQTSPDPSKQASKQKKVKADKEMA
ncbi:sulfatase-like hydrolase/transferase [Endozoicomonas sp. SM1973]|uniref:Sulfatase-like hydrolase/transferase n=1 Tax=Spartinivicinus marinus TaxID=2994442 RepID=A0A853IBH9_9GAMM|nr:sulfatase-like hydrolase/transferase [Spartinivicinus marinus]MCX4028544.1 sulfatase-like hydrolase/transferase [Spartinivicinus marinus]NYZ67211.1 sulfatase-like hydrolase/transferase [Spartinivicinus marinus]